MLRVVSNRAHLCHVDFRLRCGTGCCGTSWHRLLSANFLNYFWLNFLTSLTSVNGLPSAHFWVILCCNIIKENGILYQNCGSNVYNSMEPHGFPLVIFIHSPGTIARIFSKFFHSSMART